MSYFYREVLVETRICKLCVTLYLMLHPPSIIVPISLAASLLSPLLFSWTELLCAVQTIIQGWRLATAAARKVLAASAEDNGKDEAKFRDDLTNIAK